MHSGVPLLLKRSAVLPPHCSLAQLYNDGIRRNYRHWKKAEADARGASVTSKGSSEV